MLLLRVISIRADQHLVNAVQHAAKRNGQKTSAYIREAVQARLASEAKAKTPAA